MDNAQRAKAKALIDGSFSIEDALADATLPELLHELRIHQIELQLQQAIGFSSDILSAEQRQVEDVLRLQAREAEVRLAAPPPPGEPPIFFDRDFESSNTWPPGTELALDRVMVSSSREVKAVPVSRQHQAFCTRPIRANRCPGRHGSTCVLQRPRANRRNQRPYIQQCHPCHG